MKGIKVKKGQIWQDWDTRARVGKWQRFIQVIAIKHKWGEEYATCKNTKTEKITEIKLKRFKPNSTGYKLFNQ
jgi:hypothetical protein